MIDIGLQLDDAFALQLRNVARARGCTVQELIVQLLRGLLPQEAVPEIPAADAVTLGPTNWSREETAFLQDAAHAFDELPGGELAPDASHTEWDKPGS